MKRILILALCALLTVGTLPALAAEMPCQEGLDAATALVAMHEAVLRDVLDSDFRFSQVAGGDSIYVLYSDESGRDFLMVSLGGDDHDRVDMAVVQCYNEGEFLKNGLDSVKALALPFLTEEGAQEWDAWRAEMEKNLAQAAREGRDAELTNFSSTYLSCAVSVYHDGEKTLYTGIVSYNRLLSAGDIDLLMEE